MDVFTDRPTDLTAKAAITGVRELGDSGSQLRFHTRTDLDQLSVFGVFIHLRFFGSRLRKLGRRAGLSRRRDTSNPGFPCKWAESQAHLTCSPRFVTP